MYNIIEALHQNISKEKPLVSLDDKLHSRFYLNPSSSMSYSNIDGSPIGACIKQVWLDKKNYPVSNPITTYNEYVFEAGRLWEKWLIDQYKSMGIYLDNSVKIVDNELGISGEIDILHKNPENNSIEVTECKTYNGSFSYVTSEVLGTDKEPPKPKDSYLLQCVTYLLILRKYNISKINLIYLDRSVSKIWNHKQFLIYLDGNKIYYDTYFKNKLITIEEDRFTTDNILEKNQVLFELLESDYVPDPDYKLIYTLESLKEDHSKGLITTTEFNKVMKGNKDVSEVCSWQCISEGTLIKTEKGFVPIEKIGIKDKVYTREGFKNVVKHIDSGIKTNMVTYKLYNGIDLNCTDDHQVLTTYFSKQWKKDEKLLNNIDFRTAKDLESLEANKYVVLKIDKTVQKTNLNDDDIFLLAAFISEGNYGSFNNKNNPDKAYRVNFTLGLTEEAEAKRICDLVLSRGATSSRYDVIIDRRPLDKIHSYIQVTARGHNFVLWLKTYIEGRYSYDKYFKQIICYMEPEKQLNLIRYCCFFDGCLSLKSRNTLLDVVSTTCKIKALQFQEFYLRNNIISSIEVIPSCESSFGTEKKYISKQSYQIRRYISNKTIGKIINNFVFYRINKITETNPSKCYDLSIKDCHEFQTVSAIVHNCTYCKFGKNPETGESTCLNTVN